LALTKSIIDVISASIASPALQTCDG